MLLEKGADIHAQGGKYHTALIAAVHIGKEGIVKMLLEKGADIHAQGGIYYTALIEAARSGKEGIVKMLLEKGADIHAQGGESYNALLFASRLSSGKIVKMLLDKGAGRDPRDGSTNGIVAALKIAIHRRNEDVVRALISTGVNLNFEVDDYGSKITLLQFALKYGDGNMVQMLREAGASESIPEPDEGTNGKRKRGTGSDKDPQVDSDTYKPKGG
ncbi:ankyrin repeat-containing domain protein [Hypoxylon sp. NC1633]|nr:ankyrin repeat-containing domain protein [Hypoxylon sp. NC1633]